MPRNIDPGSLKVGKGLVPPGTVEDSSLLNPSRDVESLRVHVQDPSRAHMASSTGIVDVGGYYAADEVEGALQEIGGSHSEGRQNGVVTGFGYSDVGLVVTFASPSTALVPTLRDYSGEFITLPDNTPSVWVCIDPSTGVITQFVGATPPSITTPKNLLLWQFTTLGGVVTGARDARLYVRNLDRKLPFTVRASGPQADQESEACFVTLDAAMVYLLHSTSLDGLRTEVVIRGPVTTGPVDLPVDGVQFRGEDGATITLTSGAHLFDLMGFAGISFSDLTLTTDVPGATAIVDSVGAPPTLTPLSLNRCVFTGGLSSWDAGVDLASAGRLTVTSCKMTVVMTGISVADPLGVLIENTEVSAINFTAGSMGIRLGNPPVTTPSSVAMARGCTVTGFDIGVSIVGEAPTVTGCKVFPGISATVGIIVGTSTDAVVSGNFVDCSQNAGLVGLRADASSADITGLKVVNNTFFGARDYGIDFQGSVQESLISGNTIDCNITSSPNDPTALAGIYVHVAGVRVPSYLTISGNVVWRACTGIVLEGGASNPIIGVAVTGNTVHHCAVGVAASPANLFETSTGIGAVYCAGLNVSSNEVYGIGAILTDAGAVVLPTLADVYSEGIFFRDCTRSMASGNQVRELSLKGGGKSAGIHYDGPGIGAAYTSRGVKVSGNGIDNVPGDGILFVVGSAAAAFARTFEDASISDNTVGQVESGIRFVAGGLGVVNNLLVVGNTIDDVDTGNGITVNVVEAPGIPSGGSLQGLSVTGNTVANTAAKGVSFSCENNCTAVGVFLDQNMVRLPAGDGIALTIGTAGFAGPTLFGNVSVSGNNLTMTGAAVQAIAWSSVAGSVSDVRIEENSVLAAYDGFEIVAIGTGGGPTNTTLSNFTFRGNKVTASRRGFFGLVGGFVNGLSVTDNVVNADDTVFQLAPSAVAASSTASSGITLSRNRFVAANAGTNTQLLFSNMKVSSLFVEDNTFAQGSAASLGGVYLSLSGAGSGTAPSVRDLAVRRNTFRSMNCAGIAVTVAGPVDDAVNLDFSDNIFDGVATDPPGTLRASVFLCNIDAVVRNMSVRNNRSVASGHAFATHGGLDLTLLGARGLDVSGNQFDDAVGLLPFQYGSLFHLEASGAGDLRDVTVCKNRSRGVEVPSTSTSLSLISLDLRNFNSVENLSVCDNDLDRVNNGTGNTHGVYLRTTTDFARFSCDRNRVTGLGSNVAAFYLDVGAAGASEVSVSGNYVTGDATTGASGTGASGPGIRLNFAGVGSEIKVCNNTLIGNPDTAVHAGEGVYVNGTTITGLRVDSNSIVTYEDPITVDCNTLNNLSFRGNDAHLFSSSGATSGAFCLKVNGQGQSLTIADNRCRAEISYYFNARGWYLGFIATSAILPFAGMTFSHNTVIMTGALGGVTESMKIETSAPVGPSLFKNFVFTGNVFRDSNAGIIYTNVGSPPDQCTFMGNIGDDVSASSWSQFVGSWTNVLPAPIATFQNFNIDNGT